MSRDDRFKEMGKYAFPDHRLLPREVLEKIEKLPRNQRRFQKKIEGFYEFRVNPPPPFLAMRTEKDHLYSLADFLDFVTSGERRDDGMQSLFVICDGIVYNFTPTGDVRELAFLHAESSRFVVAGFTMVRREEQLHWAMIGGPICNLAEKTRELRSGFMSTRAKRAGRRTRQQISGAPL